MLERYRRILRDGSSIEFKTDNRDLFEFSVCEMSMADFTVEEIQIDLHNHGLEENDERLISTEYESKFVKMGRSIYRIKVRVDKNKNLRSGSE